MTVKSTTHSQGLFVRPRIYKMASAMLRGSKVLWWIPPAIGLTYHFSTVKAADNASKKVNPKDLEIYDKKDDQPSNEKPDNDSPPTALEEQISKGRKFVWKNSESAKKAADSSSRGFKKFVEDTRDFAKNIQTERTLQVKTGAITIATLGGLLLAGKGRRPLRRVFFAGGLGTAAAAVCYPNKAASTAKDAYHKVSSLFQGMKSDPTAGSVTHDDKPDPFRTAETLMLEEAIILSQMLYDELRKHIHVEDVHLSDFKTVCKDVVEEIVLGISEDFEIQTGGFIGGKHVSDTAHEPYDVLLRAQDITKRAVQEVLDSIDEDMDIQTGGTHSGVPTIALDSTVIAKDISARVTKALEDDLFSSPIEQRSYLFSDPEKLATVVSEEYRKCVEAAIRAQVKTGRCHVILNSSSIAAKTGAELREAIEQLKKRRSSDLTSGRPVKISDSRQVTERVASGLLDYIERHIATSRGQDYAYSEAGHIVRKASEEATKAIVSDIEGSGGGEKGRKTRVGLDLKKIAKMISEEVTEAVGEDIEIQTGSGFRRPPETREPKPPRKPSPPLKESEAVALEGIMLSPMYVPGLEKLADALADEISDALHGRGVVITEVHHMARAITEEVLDAINEDIEIQTGGFHSSESKPHVVLKAKELTLMAAKEVLDAIEEDMNIQTGGSLEKKRDLFLDSTRLSKKIVDAVMEEVDRDMKKGPGASDTGGPFLFSLPKQLGQLVIKELERNIEDASIGIGRNVGRIHVDVESLAAGIGRQLKNRIEKNYIRAKAYGEVSGDREIALADFGEIRKKVGATVEKNLNDNPLVTPRPGDEPLHVVEEVGSLTKRVVEEMTKAIQEDIDIQTGGARPAAPGQRLNVVIDIRQLAKKLVEEVEEAIEEDIDIQTGRGFTRKEEQEEKPMETAKEGNAGQSDPEDKDMYSTRSS